MTTPRLKAKISPAAERQARRGHPWIYSDSISKTNREGRTGEIAFLYDHHDRFLGLGLYDAHSPIRIRMLHTGKPVQINEEWWAARLEVSLSKRAGLFQPTTNAWRWVHGENDGWPGWVLDRYDSILVLKIYTAAWLPWLDSLLPLLQKRLLPTAVVLRLSRNISAQAGEAGLSDGAVLAGSLEPGHGTVPFLENGLEFEADVVRGQKTGFFLDQRDNRSIVESLAAGRSVLNVFSYSGGFSLYAARGGAREVTSLDMSAQALESARRNFARNLGRAIPRTIPSEWIRADAFAWLGSPGATAYDLIVLDPPALAKRADDRATALQSYRQLAQQAWKRLRPGGILAAASCSAQVPAEDFFHQVQSATSLGGSRGQVIRTTGQPADHPATFPEAAYLKCIYLLKPNLQASKPKAALPSNTRPKPRTPRSRPSHQQPAR